MPEPYLLLGIDVFWLSLPQKQLDLDKVDPEYYTWKYEEVGGEKYFRIIPGPLLDLAMISRYQATAEFLKRGLNVVADEVFWKFEWAKAAHKAFAGFESYMIGVYCDESVLQHREGSRGDRFPGWGKGSQYYAHRDMQYDLTVNTSVQNPLDIAREVKTAIDAGLQPLALDRLVRHAPAEAAPKAIGRTH
jgi:chloramphenicol 3-O phosphotransferase